MMWLNILNGGSCSCTMMNDVANILSGESHNVSNTVSGGSHNVANIYVVGHSVVQRWMTWLIH